MLNHYSRVMDSRIDRILGLFSAARQYPRDYIVPIEISDLNWICSEAVGILRQEETLLHLSAPLNVVGDLHGQFYDLLSYFKVIGMPSETPYLFLGDYVDRGRNSIETFAYLLALKIKYRDSVYLLRGNHETKDISSVYGFLSECKARYGRDLFNRLTDVFRYLPIAAVVSDKIFCIHGGLSPELYSLSQIESLRKPIDVPERGLRNDLLWSDPMVNGTGWAPNTRGTSYFYGSDVVEKFLRENGFDLLLRAHQVVDNGYEFAYKGKCCTLTLFSAPNYCNCYGNRGAMIKLSQDLRCDFVQLKAAERKE